MTEAKQPEAGFVEVNGTNLYYEMMGEGYPLELMFTEEQLGEQKERWAPFGKAMQ
jgi:hypothetical protein